MWTVSILRWFQMSSNLESLPCGYHTEAQCPRKFTMNTNCSPYPWTLWPQPTQTTNTHTLLYKYLLIFFLLYTKPTKDFYVPFTDFFGGCIWIGTDGLVKVTHIFCCWAIPQLLNHLLCSKSLLPFPSLAYPITLVNIVLPNVDPGPVSTHQAS